MSGRTQTSIPVARSAPNRAEALRGEAALREELRLLYHLDDPALAPAHLDAWLAWASRSRLRPFVRLARTLRGHRDGILAPIRLGLSNGRLEGLNSKIRLISHRSFGFTP
ncbi:MAG TPA: transposase [Vicinamibacterales bacterium]|nr:transposase [Vicinamibacterales bacterium]